MKSVFLNILMFSALCARVCITEVNSTESAYASYVELCNIGHVAIDISGYTLTYGNDGTDKFSDVPLNSDYYASGLVLSPGEYFLVLRSENSFPSEYPHVPLNTGEDEDTNSKIEYMSHGNLYLNGGTDYLILEDESGQVVDRFNDMATEWQDNHLWYRTHLPNDGSVLASHWQDQGMNQPGTPAATNDVSLPVELSIFNAVPAGGQIRLHWQTESEFQNVGFKVERSESKEGPYLQVSSLIPGHGTVTSVNQYEFFDRLQGNEPDSLWYRLIQYDMSGKFKVLGPVLCLTVTQSGKTEFDLYDPDILGNYPNPFYSETNIYYRIKSSENFKVVIVNQVGEIIKVRRGGKNGGFRWTGKNDKGTEVASGIYFGCLWENDRLISLIKMTKIQ